MKSKIFVSILFILIATLRLSGASRAGEDLVSLIPDDVMVVMAINSIKSDLGLSYLMELGREQSKRKESSQNVAAIEKVYARMDPLQVVGAVLAEPEENIFRYIIAVNITDASKEQEKYRILLQALNTLLTREVELQTLTYQGHKITYSVDRWQRDPEDISAYTCINGNVILGSGIDVLKRVIMVVEGKDRPVLQTKKFINMKTRLAKGLDGFIYLNNRDRKFTKILRQWEKEWHMTLLLSAESIESMGLSFDIVDPDTARGKMVFESGNEQALPDIRDDAEFVGEAIMRKFIAEKIEYTRRVAIDEEYVTLNFEVMGLKPLWARAFGKEPEIKVVEHREEPKMKERKKEVEKEPEIKEVAEEEVEPVSEETPEKIKKTSYLPKVMLLLWMLVIALVIILVKRERSRK